MITEIKVEEGKNEKLKFKYGIVDKESIPKEVRYLNNYFPKIGNDQNFKINENDTVIDVGANVGIFSVYAANVANKGKVFAFEPVAENFEKLEYHRNLNELNNLTVVNKAISDKSKKVKIYLAHKNSGGHSMNKNKFELLHETPNAKIPSEMIETIPLKSVFDTYNIDRCNFLKIDCEGEEYNILTKLPIEYFKKIDKISLEFHNPVIDEIKLAKYLVKHGYRVTISNFGRPLGMIFASRI